MFDNKPDEPATVGPSPAATRRPPAVASSGNRAHSYFPRWHLFYFVLAGFDLLMVLASLYLGKRGLDTYIESVAVNQRWADLAGKLTDLGELAGKVNAPGNDIFQSGDLPGERKRWAAAERQYSAHQICCAAS